MVYKKYIYKNGERHGPYYYHSYRDGNSIKKIYIGGKKEYKKFLNKKNKKIGFIVPAIILLAIIGFFIFQLQITGKFVLELQDSYISGENISGILKLGLKKGELLPIDSQIVVEQEKIISETPLINLISANSNGNFYIENAEISGKGEGYGFLGEKLASPQVFFKLEVYDSSEAKEKEETNSEKETPAIETPAIETPAIETPAIETPAIETPAIETPITEAPQTTQSEETTSKTSESSAESEDSNENLITGAVVEETEQVIGGSCSKGQPFSYTLEEGKTAKIKQDSAEIKEIDENGELKSEKLADDAVTLQISNNNAEVTTDYLIKEPGFGKDFLQDEINFLEIDLSKLEIQAEQGTLSISLVYQGKELAKESKEISVEQPKTEENATEKSVTPLDVETIQYKAVIGKPVKWLKIIKIENKTGLILELPKSSNNISIRTGEEIQRALQEAKEYDGKIDEADRASLISKVTGEAISETGGKQGILSRFFNWLAGIVITGKIIQEQEIENAIIETNENKIIELTKIIQQEQEIAVEYYTEAPLAEETNITGGKRIVVTASDGLNYTNVLAYTLLDNKIPTSNTEDIKLYLVGKTREKVNFSSNDLDNDSMTDYVEWSIQHLSGQIYEIVYKPVAISNESQSNIALNSGWNLISLTLKENDDVADRAIPIALGRNLIGYSSDKEIALENVRFVDSNGNSFKWAEAVEKNKLSAYLQYLDADNPIASERKYKYAATAELEKNDVSLRKNKGYWVYANEKGNLIFPGVGGTLEGQTYNWSELRFSDGTDEKNITEAKEAGWLFGSESAAYINYYENGYKKVCGTEDCDNTNLESWRGYFIWSNKDNIQLIRRN